MLRGLFLYDKNQYPHVSFEQIQTSVPGWVCWRHARLEGAPGAHSHALRAIPLAAGLDLVLHRGLRLEMRSEQCSMASLDLSKKNAVSVHVFQCVRVRSHGRGVLWYT